MAKAAKTAIKKEGAQGGGKDYVKVVKSVKSEKTGAYTFKEAFVHKDNAKAWLAEN